MAREAASAGGHGTRLEGPGDTGRLCKGDWGGDKNEGEGCGVVMGGCVSRGGCAVGVLFLLVVRCE